MVFDENDFFAVLGSFTPGRLNVTLDESGFNIKDGSFSTSGYDAIFIHEQMHFFQTAFTGYGQTTWNRFRQMVTIVEAEWQKVTQHSKRIIPLGNIVKIGDERAKKLAFLLHKYYYERLGLQNLRVNAEFDLLSEYRLSICDKDWQINPTINCGEYQYKLQGKDILESQAKFLEAIYLHMCHNISIDKTIDIKKLHNKYWVPYIWFIRQIGPNRMQEFPLICDLALQTVWNDPPKDESDWKKSHPAWRFVKLVEAAKKVDPKWCENLEKIKLNYEKYVDRLLDICKFKSLDEIIELSLKFYCHRENTNLAIERMMKEALLYRKKNYWCAANPFIDFDVWKEMHIKFMPPSIQVGNTMKIIPTDGKILDNKSKEADLLSHEHTVELHLQALIAQILGRRSNYLIDIDQLQCGFGYFGIKDVCEYQKKGLCQGGFNPKDGSIDPMIIRGNEVIGCEFEILLYIRGIKVSDIELNFRNSEITII